MRNKNWFWGVFFLLAAVFVIGSQIGGTLGQLGVWNILATILLVSLVIRSLIDRNFFSIFLSLVFLYMIYRGPLQLPYISVWLLLAAAVLAGVGCNLLFGTCPIMRRHRAAQERPEGETIDDNRPYARASFSSSSQYLHADHLEGGRFIASFGSLDVYFDQAKVSPEGAEIFLDCSFGEIKLYVPRSWRVEDNLHVNLGNVENDTRQAQPAEDAPRLTLYGDVRMGNVEVKYI